jgi:hypothetical protein
MYFDELSMPSTGTRLPGPLVVKKKTLSLEGILAGDDPLSLVHHCFV